MSPLLQVVPRLRGFGAAELRFRMKLTRGSWALEPLSFGIEDAPLPERTDVGPEKRRVDVIVDGFAFAKGGSARESLVRLRCGAIDQRAMVFGDRRVTHTTNGWAFTSPSPFERIPLLRELAYGGIDSRVDVPEGTVLGSKALVDHPGLYPRNRNGKGYAVYDLEEGLVLPSFEDPDDLLTPERMVVSDPRNWYLMPRPVCFDWQGPLTFPRARYLGYDAWFPPPSDAALPELERGHVREELLVERSILACHPRFFQEAQEGMILDGLVGGEEVVAEGMHPTKAVVTVRIPPLPRVTIAIDGVSEEVAPLPQTLHVRPHDESVSVVCVAKKTLPRALISGVHKRFPVTASIDGGAAIACEPPPPTTREMSARFSSK